jgi:hypothetical protein
MTEETVDCFKAIVDATFDGLNRTPGNRAAVTIQELWDILESNYGWIPSDTPDSFIYPQRKTP